jgi:hypothetical protein
MLAAMSARPLSRVVVIVLTGLLAGCGLFEDDDRAPWRAQAEATCFARQMVKLSSVIVEADEVDGKGSCGLDRPLRVSALADGSVQIGGRPLTMSCPVTAALERWVRESVQPAALQMYGVPVVEIRSMGTYNCRTRNNRAGARLSEHAFANAIDVSGFLLADGTTVSVLKDWRGSPAARAFLRTVHGGACGPFTTVLGPGSDGLHENHLHLDLARHNVQGTMRYCRPKPAAPPAGSAPTIWVKADPGTVVAALPPGEAAWPRVLPQSVAAPANAPLTAPTPSMASDPAMAGPDSIGALIDATPAFPASQPAYPANQHNCPPGYVCTPAPAYPEPPPALGWQVGPSPAASYAPDITGSAGYEAH